MARVTITVEREGGSTITIVEQSAFPLHTDEQCGRLAQEAFLRSLMALGVSLSPPQPEPDPTPPAAAQPVPVGDVPAAADAVAEAADRQNRSDRKAA